MSGSHWVATYVKDKVINYFDSFGLPPFQEMVNHARKKNLTLLHQNNQIQNLLTTTCGYFCLYFLNEMNKGISYFDLLKSLEPISKEVGYDVIEASNDEIIPLTDLSDENQKLIIFDDYLNTGKKNDERIRDYFTNSRNKNCSCIYLSQSYYGTDKTIRLNCSHFCVFDFPSINEQSMICRELNINKSDYQKATKDPYSFLYVDKVKKKVARNFDEKI